MRIKRYKLIYTDPRYETQEMCEDKEGIYILYQDVIDILEYVKAQPIDVYVYPSGDQLQYELFNQIFARL